MESTCIEDHLETLCMEFVFHLAQKWILCFKNLFPLAMRLTSFKCHIMQRVSKAYNQLHRGQNVMPCLKVGKLLSTSSSCKVYKETRRKKTQLENTSLLIFKVELGSYWAKIWMLIMVLTAVGIEQNNKTMELCHAVKGTNLFMLNMVIAIPRRFSFSK